MTTGIHFKTLWKFAHVCVCVVTQQNDSKRHRTTKTLSKLAKILLSVSVLIQNFFVYTTFAVSHAITAVVVVVVQHPLYPVPSL